MGLAPPFCFRAGPSLFFSSELLSVIVMTYPCINDPKYWWERAEEARSIAKLLDDQEAKRQMLAIAASYDRLSDHMKRRPRKLRSGPSVKRKSPVGGRS
jgi:hypothetical protein